jgi:hypothetical protein
MAISSRPGDLSITTLAYRRSIPTIQAMPWTAAVTPRIFGRLLSAARAGSMVVAIVTDIVFRNIRAWLSRRPSKSPEDGRMEIKQHKHDKQATGREKPPFFNILHSDPFGPYVTCHSYLGQVLVYLFRPCHMPPGKHGSTINCHAELDQDRSHRLTGCNPELLSFYYLDMDS